MQFKNAENYSILATSHTEKIQYLCGSSGYTSLKWTVHTISCLSNVLSHVDVGIFRFFLVELQVLFFSLTMVAAFPIIQQGDRLGWFGIQNWGAHIWYLNLWGRGVHQSDSPEKSESNRLTRLYCGRFRPYIRTAAVLFSFKIFNFSVRHRIK